MTTWSEFFRIVEEILTSYVAYGELQTLLPGASIVGTPRQEGSPSPSPPGDDSELHSELYLKRTCHKFETCFCQTSVHIVWRLFEESSCTKTILHHNLTAEFFVLCSGCLSESASEQAGASRLHEPSRQAARVLAQEKECSWWTLTDRKWPGNNQVP